MSKVKWSKLFISSAAIGAAIFGSMAYFNKYQKYNEYLDDDFDDDFEDHSNSNMNDIICKTSTREYVSIPKDNSEQCFDEESARNEVSVETVTPVNVEEEIVVTNEIVQEMTKEVQCTTVPNTYSSDTYNKRNTYNSKGYNKNYPKNTNYSNSPKDSDSEYKNNHGYKTYSKPSTNNAGKSNYNSHYNSRYKNNNYTTFNDFSKSFDRTPKDE